MLDQKWITSPILLDLNTGLAAAGLDGVNDFAYEDGPGGEFRFARGIEENAFGSLVVAGFDHHYSLRRVGGDVVEKAGHVERFGERSSSPP